jgi:hypothetical protein
MRLYGLLEYCRFGTWPIPGLNGTAASYNIDYDPETPPANFVDKFYYALETIDLNNYLAKGTWIKDSTSTAATSLVFIGLPAGREVNILGVRHVNGVPTTDFCVDVIPTPRDRIEVTPALCNVTSNWAGEGFTDWFRLQEEANLLSYRNMSDAVLGDFVRMDYDQDHSTPDPLNDPDWQPESPTIGYLVIDGRKKLSPRYDWEYSMEYRFHGLSGGFFQGMTIGINSGPQAVAAVTIRGSHTAWEDTNPAVDRPAGTSLAPSSATQYQALSTSYPWGASLAGDDPHTGWWIVPTNERPDDYAKWVTQEAGPTSKNRLRITYQAEDKVVDGLTIKGKTVRFYNKAGNAPEVLFLEIGPDAADAPAYLRRWPHNHYGLPVTMFLRTQQWWSADSVQRSDIFDIGKITMKSSCPYHYAGYAASTGYHASVHSVRDGDTAFAYDDLTLQTMHNFGYVVGKNTSQLWPSRFTTNLYTGFTSPLVGISTKDLIPVGQGSPFASGTVTGKTLPIHVPANSKLKCYAFQGIPRKGTVKATLLGDGVAMSTKATVTQVLDTVLLNSTPLAPQVIQAEIEVYYDGTSTATGLDYSYSPMDLANQSQLIPDSPSMFVGFEVYFEPPPSASNDHPTGTYYGTQTVTLTPNSAAAEVYYTLDGSEPTSANTLYAAPIEIADTATLKVIAYDSLDSAGDVQTFSYTILPPLLESDNVTVTPSISEAQLTGTLSADSVSATPNASAAELVGTLIADSVTVTPAVSAAELTGVLVADDVAVTPVVTLAELQTAALTGSGSIRSPSGAVVAQYLADGTPVTNYRYIQGVWQ